MRKDFESPLCIIPWLSVQIDSSGHYRPCYSVNNKFPKISNTTIENFFNSDIIKNIRVDFLNKNIPEVCKECIDLNRKVGCSSLRSTLQLKRYTNNTWDYFLENTKKNGELSISPISLDIRLDNNCNLACRMCHPNSSKNLNKEYKNILNKTLKEKNYNHLKNIEFWNSIISTIKKSKEIVNIYIIGGEPLISLYFFNFVDLLIKSNLCKMVNLRFSTNLTIIDHKIIDKLKKFNKTIICCSLDGLGKVLEYQRFPSNSKKILRNLEFLINNKSSNINIKIDSTLTILNIYYYPEFLEFLEQYKKNIFYFDTIKVSNPEWLSVSILPLEIKSLIKNKYDIFLKKIETKYPLQRVLKMLYSAEPNEENLKKFGKLTNAFDKNRKQDFFEINPQFKLLKKYFI